MASPTAAVADRHAASAITGERNDAVAVAIGSSSSDPALRGAVLAFFYERRGNGKEDNGGDEEEVEVHDGYNRGMVGVLVLWIKVRAHFEER